MSLPAAANSGQYLRNRRGGIEQAPLDQQVGAHRGDALRGRVHEYDGVRRPRAPRWSRRRCRPRGRRPARPSTYTHTAAPTSSRASKFSANASSTGSKSRLDPSPDVGDAPRRRTLRRHDRRATSATPTATTKRCSARTAGAPSRTRPRTSVPTCGREHRCSTSGAGRAPSPSTSPTRVAPANVIGIDAAPGRDRSRRTPNATSRAPRTSSSGSSDLYALGFADDSFDIVHAHQVLQHLTDPVARAPRDAARVQARAGSSPRATATTQRSRGIPREPELDAWLAMYETVARANQGEPDAGRFLLSWAHAAGFTDVQAGASAWCFATPEERAWWGYLWADRITESAIATQAVEVGAASTRSAARRWPTPGGAGPPNPTAGSQCCTARSSAQPDVRCPKHCSVAQAGIARPPSITRVWPVTNLASSLAKNTHAPARSSGFERALHRGHRRSCPGCTCRERSSSSLPSWSRPARCS